MTHPVFTVWLSRRQGPEAQHRLQLSEGAWPDIAKVGCEALFDECFTSLPRAGTRPRASVLWAAVSSAPAAWPDACLLRGCSRCCSLTPHPSLGVLHAHGGARAGGAPAAEAPPRLCQQPKARPGFPVDTLPCHQPPGGVQTVGVGCGRAPRPPFPFYLLRQIPAGLFEARGLAAAALKAFPQDEVLTLPNAATPLIQSHTTYSCCAALQP